MTSTGQSRQGRIFLNFGADWRTGFTVAVERRHVRLFEEAGIDLAGLEGAVIDPWERNFGLAGLRFAP